MNPNQVEEKNMNKMNKKLGIEKKSAYTLVPT